MVVERLDFRAKKARLREASPHYSRKLSHFAYAAFHALLVSRAAREGVEVIEVNPAYTSVIGKVKFMARYGLSPHGAAEADARPVPASLRGRPRQGGTPIRSGTGGRRPARPGAGWSGLGPGVRSPGANRRERCSPGVVSRDLPMNAYVFRNGLIPLRWKPPHASAVITRWPSRRTA